MPKPKRDDDRERRIAQEIVVDAYGSEEQAVSWYCYLDGALSFPFVARCTSGREISPLKVGETLDVIGMADESECGREMFVKVRRDGRTQAIPLGQLEAVDGERDETIEAIQDWAYWFGRGYQF